jgi:hypothetical protein
VFSATIYFFIGVMVVANSVFASGFEETIRHELGSDFTVKNMRKIYYVATNGTGGDLIRYTNTIARMDDHLTKYFVKQRPLFSLKVYLFKDAGTYQSFCFKYLKEDPSTPFGFYRSDGHLLVMNIATGNGTLAHELVHPFVESDFPGAPSWFNEGFASLYEQSMESNGKMMGLVNWRLPALQKAIRNKKCPGLSSFMADTSDNFYADDSGVSYGLARYLCFYLQQQGRLEQFYKSYRDQFSKDITGKKILETITGKKLSDFEKSLHSWVLQLHYDPR